ncbi:MAG TPA: polysaccharide deacetylase family protein [Gemmatimonadaceae bacterium]|nr:polysaccharide deacetylase family protein [Gemmatimonadaceae bacterium]
MLRDLKLSLLRASRAVGAFALSRASDRRDRQLLILCYHGISISDEHQWAPGLYMSQEMFADRVAHLERGRYAILPLDEGIRRLYDGTLPPRSVVMTFDDGNFDFYSRAWPVLERSGFPVTVYLTTYYCEKNLPIFPLAISYLLWKGQGIAGILDVTRGHEVVIDSSSPAAMRRTQATILREVDQLALSGIEKDAVANRLADVLGVDFADIRRRRLLHLMNAAEVAELAGRGVGFQLHSHRHRSPLDRDEYVGELMDNRDRIAGLTGTTPRHFCYPSGVCMPQFAAWLHAAGVLSATTCEPGMCTPKCNRFQLPRLLDHSEMTGVEFESWLAGLGHLLPRRSVGFQPVDRDGRLIIGPPAEAASPPLAGTSRRQR